MSCSIKKLPDLLINQIAAGEVVENPTSCIKELVENSIDAGSTHIDIFIKSGGFLSIQIIDNGSGISEDDVEIAFERHTTSKIRQLEDLDLHQKMGFRGEALASIASCSKVILKTSTQDGSGIVLHLDAGRIISKEKSSLKKGTSIEIQDLFFNTPARKKFQKTVSSSTQDIQKTILSLIFAHPKVSFRLKSDQTFLIDAQIDHSLDLKKAFRKRIYDHFSHVNVDKGMFLDMQDPIVSVFGFLAPFDAHTNTRKNQHFVVNSRPVDALSLSFTLQEALKTFLPEKRFFQGVFHIDIDPKWIDINIHPQKKEIRFQEEGYIRDVLRRLVAPKIQLPQISKLIEAPPSYKYDFSLPKEVATQQNIIPQNSFRYIKTLGYYPPYLLIDSNEIDFMDVKKGLVFFDVKKALCDLKLNQFKASKAPFGSQNLLIPHNLKLNNQEKQHLQLLKTSLKLLGFEVEDDLILAHPQELDSLDAGKLVQELVRLSIQGLSFEELLPHFFDTFYKHKRIDFEEAQKTLSSYAEKKIHPDSNLICVLSESKIKELFYERS
jgi:DNA mismatch repair protein MutL